MIYLTLNWPEQCSRYPLAKGKQVIFDISHGTFIETAVASSRNALIFSHTVEGLTLRNTQQAPHCYVDGYLLACGEELPLHVNSTVQLARYGIVIEDDDTEKSLQQVLGFSEEHGNEEPQPELMDILYNSLQHVTEEPEIEKRDVLKALEKEFLHALIWGIQKPQVRHSGTLRESRFTEKVFDFDQVQARVKSATVTHCIFETPALIHKIFDEMKLDDGDDVLCDRAEKKDVLRLLAPEDVRYDTKKRIPDLLVQEIYRADLNTLL